MNAAVHAPSYVVPCDNLLVSRHAEEVSCCTGVGCMGEQRVAADLAGSSCDLAVSS